MPRDGMEIERAHMPVRRKRAITRTAPIVATPASAPIAEMQNLSGDGGQFDDDTQLSIAPVAPIDRDESLDREQRASILATPMRLAPAASPIAETSPSQRRRRTSVQATPMYATSSVAPIEPSETPVRKRRAGTVPTPTVSLPGVSPIGQDEGSGSEGPAT
jgi:hypothetical protein